jgi:large conductance mechanosensitive channel
MPPIGWLLSGVDFANLYIILKRGKKSRVTKANYKSLLQARDDGAVTVNFGIFINSLLNFVVITGIIWVFVRTINRLRRKKENQVASKDCDHCYSRVDVRARRCPHCTSDLKDNGHHEDHPPSSPEQAEDSTGEEDEKREKGAVKPQKYLKKTIKKQLSQSVLSFPGM